LSGREFMPKFKVQNGDGGSLSFARTEFLYFHNPRLPGESRDPGETLIFTGPQSLRGL
jgi:hypothetical protein